MGGVHRGGAKPPTSHRKPKEAGSKNARDEPKDEAKEEGRQ